MSADEPADGTPALSLVSDADVATWAAADRQELFNEVAAAMNLNPTVIEKDYWVSFTLRHVFTGPMRDALVFKGGTSLSKVYGLIRRFSEDIDLCVNRTALGLPTTLVGDANRSKTQQRMVASQVQDACMTWVHDQMLPALRSAFSDSLGLTGWRCATDTSAPHELAFEYPVADAATRSASSYLAPRILLQFGARSVGTPSDWREIRPLCASQRPTSSSTPAFASTRSRQSARSGRRCSLRTPSIIAPTAGNHRTTGMLGTILTW